MKRFLSWGLGVQSTTLGVMSALGDLEPLDLIGHADTQNERLHSLESKAFYTPWFERHGIAVRETTAGNIVELGAVEHIHIPFWTSTGGPLQRQCTLNFKILPLRRLMRTFAGYDPSAPPHPKPGEFELWLGISWDEWQRMSTSEVRFIAHRFPLIEKKMTRDDCVDYLVSKGLPVPGKSACIVCPYRSASAWLEMRDTSPEEWNLAIEFDRTNRHNPLAATGAGSTADALYIYNHGQNGPEPLETANLEADAERERMDKQNPLFVCFGNVCYV